MAEAAFNTIAEIQRLRDAGFPQAQAEAITLSIHSGVTGGVATKDDVERAEERLNGKINLLDGKVEAVDGKIDSIDQKIDLVKETLEAQIKAVDQKIDTSVKALDDKIDLVKDSLEAQINGVKVSLEAKIEKQSSDLGEQIANGFADAAERQVVQLRWMIATIIGSIGVLVAAFAAFQ